MQGGKGEASQSVWEGLDSLVKSIRMRILQNGNASENRYSCRDESPFRSCNIHDISQNVNITRNIAILVLYLTL
jgi:hypothetical protein